MKIPLYKKLHSILREHIITGLYKEGDLLPSENELCVTHNVTRPTVRQALNELVREGYINKHHGKGSIVTIPSKEAGILSIQGTSSAIGKGLRTKIITKPYIARWDDPFFFELSKHEMESGCIKMERIRLINNVPVRVFTRILVSLSGDSTIFTGLIISVSSSFLSINLVRHCFNSLRLTGLRR